MIISGSTGTLAAGANSGNVIAGSPFETIGRTPRQITIAMTSDQADTLFDFLIGGIAIASRALISGADRFPILPDDMALTVTGLPGQKLYLVIYAVTALVAPGVIYAVHIL